MTLSHLPLICLGTGLFWSLVIGNPFRAFTGPFGKGALQISVVGLGFGVDLSILWRAGLAGIGLSLVTLILTLSLGVFLGKRLGLSRNLALLVSMGTAICGGSAIAAAAPTLGASDSDTAASLAAVFILNAFALLLFPELGRLLALSPETFGQWAALAIHDTSSVVGAALAYDPASLATATTIKLSRALWIAPCCLVLALVARTASDSHDPRGGRRMVLPWFIPGFIGASMLRSLAPDWPLFDDAVWLAKIGLSLSLLCIGAGVSRHVLKNAGGTALGLGFVLWVSVAGLSLGWLMF